MGATESKLAFRKNVFQLWEQRNIPVDQEEYWSNFYKLPESAEDVFNLFAPKDIRKVRDTAPENLVTLLDKVITRMSIVAAKTTKLQTEDTRDVLNCARILTRLLPYIFEVEGGGLDRQLFWEGAAEGKEGDGLWGERICHLVVELLFFQGFTLPDSTDPATVGPQYVIWQQGVGASSNPPATAQHINNRTEILRLLLTLLSRTIYYSPAEILKADNRWGVELVTQLDKKPMLSLLCSLLNTAMHYDPVGWRLLPYNHLLFADAQEQHVAICLQSLTALLDVVVPPTAAVESEEGKGKEAAVEGSTESLAFTSEKSDEQQQHTGDNKFCLYLSKLHRTQDFELILNGIHRIVKNPLDSANTYLPGSTKRVSIHVETLTLFWKLLENNEKFASYVVENDKILHVTAALVYFALQARTEPAQIGLARLSAFILHILSQYRNYGVQLNTTFDHTTAGPVAKQVPLFSAGCWGDFLVLAIYTLVTTSSRSQLATLQETFMIVMTNVSPYIKSLTVTTSNKLLSLFNSFASPAFLVANESNHKLTFYLLEVFNNVVQYQVTGNTQLIYSIIRHKQKFVDLHQLSFDEAVGDLNRIRSLKAAIRQGGAPQSPTAVSPGAEGGVEGGVSREGSTQSLEGGEEGGLSEKAKGKLPADGEPERRQSTASVGTVDGGKGKFVPNPEWFHFWTQHLPLTVILTLCDALGPTIEKLCVDKGLTDDREILEYLKSGTLVGILPPPHPIYVRRFHYGDAVRVWFAGYLWGQVFLKATGVGGSGGAEVGKMCPPIWTGTHVKLFHVKLAT
ncbi:cell wall biogenesis protein [Rhizophlyctis rosea]|nr:cell wall biogenesis protein [Rhizophlyctis rosea]